MKTSLIVRTIKGQDTFLGHDLHKGWITTDRANAYVFEGDMPHMVYAQVHHILNIINIPLVEPTVMLEVESIAYRDEDTRSSYMTIAQVVNNFLEFWDIDTQHWVRLQHWKHDYKLNSPITTQQAYARGAYIRIKNGQVAFVIPGEDDE